MARLREAYEYRDWRWESERRQAVHDRIDCLENFSRRKSLVPIDATFENQLEELRTAGLPGTIQLTDGLLTIRCNDMEDLLRQLVLLAKMADSDYEHLRALIEATVLRRSPASEATAGDSDSSRSA
jgi:hypothetical protein